MKIAITGAGAMGSAFAFLFGKSEAEIALYEKSEDVVNEIRRRGLTVHGGGEYSSFHPEISTKPSILRGADLIVILVKSYSTRGLMEEVSRYIGKDTAILSLQNGLGNREIMEQYIPGERIIMGTTTLGATKTTPAKVSIRGIGGAVIENSPGYSDMIKRLFQSAGIETTFSCDVKKVLIEKAIINASINPLGALFTMKNGELILNSHSLSIMENVIYEIVSIPEISAMGFTGPAMKDKVISVCRTTEENRCSMLQDIENGRPTEIDYINGYFVKLAEKSSMKVPVNSTLLDFVKIIESRS